MILQLYEECDCKHIATTGNFSDLERQHHDRAGRELQVRAHFPWDPKEEGCQNTDRNSVTMEDSRLVRAIIGPASGSL